MTTKNKELMPIYENVKSYYKKAYIKTYYNKNKIILKSYNTNILKLENNDLIFYNKNINNKKIYSQTTLRHIKEFLKQFYMIDYNKKITKNDIKKLIKKEGV